MENIQKTFETLNNNALEINNGPCNTHESNTLNNLIEGFDEVVSNPNLRPTWTACLGNVKPLSGQQRDNTPMIIPLPKPPEHATKASFQATTNVGPQKARTMQSTTHSVLDPLKPAEPATAAKPARSAKPAAQLKLQENTFETVTRMMTREDLQAVLNESAGREKQINDLSRILQLEKGNWQAIWQGIISRYKEEGPDFLAKDGLIAFRDGSISMEQFCTLTTCWSLMKEFPNSEIQVQPLFDADDNPVSHAKDALKSSIYTDDYIVNFFTSEEEAEGITNLFFENMKTKSPSEKVFFSIEVDLVFRNPESIGPLLNEALGFRACNFFVDFEEDEPQKKRILPSFSMVQAFVDACGQENTIAPSPVIGFSSVQDIYDNIIKHGRDVLLPFPGRTYDKSGEIIHPITADERPVDSYMDFYLHDLYHCVLVSYVPDGCRQETARLAKMIEFERNGSDKNSFAYHFFNELYDRLVDMEFILFRPDSQQKFEKNYQIIDRITDGELFLCQLHLLVKKTLIFFKEKLKTPDSPGRQQECEDFLHDNPIFSKIVDTFCDHGDHEGFFTKYLCRPLTIGMLRKQEFFNLYNLAPRNASILDQSLKRLLPPS